MSKVECAIHRLNGFIGFELLSLSKEDRKKVIDAIIENIRELEKFGAWDA